MDTTKTMTWETPNGTKVEIIVKGSEYTGKTTIEARANGRHITAADNITVHPNGITIQGHTVYGEIGPVKITSRERVETIVQMYEEVKAAVENTPQAALNRLKDERERLRRELGYTIDAWHESYQRLIEAIGQGYRTDHDEDAWQAKIAEARQRLAEFDRQHPEVLEAIKREEQEAFERNLWN